MRARTRDHQNVKKIGNILCRIDPVNLISTGRADPSYPLFQVQAPPPMRSREIFTFFGVMMTYC